MTVPPELEVARRVRYGHWSDSHPRMAKKSFFCNEGACERTCIKITKLRRERSVQLLAWKARTNHRLEIMPVPVLQPGKFKEARLAETKQNAYLLMTWCMECGMIDSNMSPQGRLHQKKGWQSTTCEQVQKRAKVKRVQEEKAKGKVVKAIKSALKLKEWDSKERYAHQSC